MGFSESGEAELVPSLRFPEFRGTPQWEKKRLNELDKIVGGGTPSTVKNEYWSGTINWFTPTELKEKYVFKSNKTISDLGLQKSSAKLLPVQSIWLTTRATIGNVSICIQECTTNQGFQNIVVNKNNYNEFVYYLLLKNKNKLVEKASGSTFQEISKVELSKIVFVVPFVDEQKKIAGCLSSLDDLISLSIQKLGLLKAHKKGLMSVLFPSNSVPKLRFSEFTNNVAWETKTIKSVCNSIFSGGTPTTTKKSYYGGKIPFIRSAEIDKEKTELFLTQEGLNNSAAKLVKKGDVLIALYGANSGNVAISKIEGAINQAILCLQSNYSNPFIYHYFTYKKDLIVSSYIQGGQGNLSGEIVKSIELKFPKLLREQKKVAGCLSSLDNLILLQDQKINALKSHKIGLMQALFPALD